MVATLLLSTFGRPLQHWVYGSFGVGFAAWVISGLLIFSVVLVLGWMFNHSVRERSLESEINQTRLVPIFLIGTLLAIGVAIIILVLDRPEERLHFVTFGFYGFFTGALFAARSWVLAVILVALFSGLDELYQWWLPDRVGDWRDVRMNMLAGSIGLVLQRFGVKRT